MDEKSRRDKLDDALLFVMGSVGILFGIIQVFVGFPILLQVVAPVVLLGWVLPFYLGYVRGALQDCIADRYRGWIFLVIGLTMYAYVAAEEELSSLITDPKQVWIIPASSVPLLLVLFWRFGRFRRFILGPAFPRNEVLSLSSYNAALVAGLIAISGGLLAVAKITSIWGLIYVAIFLAGPIGVPATIFMRRSNRLASQVFWPYNVVERRSPLYGHTRFVAAYRVLNVATLVLFYAGAVPLIVVWYFNYYPSLLIAIAQVVLGWAFIVLLATFILYLLTRTRRHIDFDGPFSDNPPVEHPI